MTTNLWKRNAVVAVVLLFICVGIYLNWSYNQDEDVETSVELADTLDTALLDAAETDTESAIASVDALTDEVVVVSDGEDYDALLTQADTDTSMSEYFAAIRLARQESRDSAVELLQETIAYETGADDTAASTASTQLETMVNTALQEAEIEGLVIAKGFEDCVTYMSDGAISVAVAAPEEGLSTESVAQICDIVVTQSDYSPSQLKIIEVR
jgi:stage III sporulation protein AH